MISGGRSGLGWRIAVARLICPGCLLEACSPSAAQKAPTRLVLALFVPAKPAKT